MLMIQAVLSSPSAPRRVRRRLTTSSMCYSSHYVVRILSTHGNPPAFAKPEPIHPEPDSLIQEGDDEEATMENNEERAKNVKQVDGTEIKKTQVSCATKSFRSVMFPPNECVHARPWSPWPPFCVTKPARASAAGTRVWSSALGASR